MNIHPVPAANSAIPGSIPPPARKTATLAGRLAGTRGVTVPPPPPQPLPAQNTGSLFRKVWQGGGKVSTCQWWWGRMGSSSQPAVASQMDRGQQGTREQSPASWHGSVRGASVGPRSRTWRKAAGRPEGHKRISREPNISFLLCRKNSRLCLTPRPNCPLPS